MYWCSLPILLFLTVSLCAQPGGKVLQIQLVDADTRRGVPSVGLQLLGLGAGVTNSDGIVRIAIPMGTETVELQAPRGFEVLDPPGTIQPVPASDAVIIKFYIKAGLLDRLNAQLRQLEADRDALRKSMARLSISQDSLQRVATQLEMDRDSFAILQAVQQQERQLLQDSFQRVQTGIGAAKLRVYREISENYNQYLNALLNFSEYLEKVSRAFVNQGELQQFNQYVEALNIARDAMHEKYLGYLATVQEHWDANTKIELEQLYDRALNRIYQTELLPLNEQLVEELRKAWNKEVPRIRAQRRATKASAATLQRLDDQIEDLQVQGKRVLALLQL